MESYDIAEMKYKLSITPKWRWLCRKHLRQDINNTADALFGECG